MELTFVDSVFQDDRWWDFLGLYTLMWWWIMVLQLDWLSRILDGDLDMVMVFLSDWRWLVRNIL